ncbi:hypothetical protein [Amycolatopsis granulosa]|uniref:hypothetical protein n=1 Tax=Amycolatopsis granulosa TaxID=185684 RepID=UPI001422F449|nr:hypothetical protein [Amycolatopsis granulosa]NIH83900.1 hypothetical protein [Amycolatopsis granulosa]
MWFLPSRPGPSARTGFAASHANQGQEREPVIFTRPGAGDGKVISEPDGHIAVLIDNGVTVNRLTADTDDRSSFPAAILGEQH